MHPGGEVAPRGGSNKPGQSNCPAKSRDTPSSTRGPPEPASPKTPAVASEASSRGREETSGDAWLARTYPTFLVNPRILAPRVNGRAVEQDSIVVEKRSDGVSFLE